VGYTNGERTGLNKYETKVSRKFGMEFGKVGGGTGHDSTPLL